MRTIGTNDGGFWITMGVLTQECEMILTTFSLALEERRKPTPPIVEPEVFLVAEEVMSWYEPTL